jgi:histidinol-phosphate aminotransferase
MSLSRRAFFSTVGGTGAPEGAFIAARGREALVGERGEAGPSVPAPPDIGEVRINSNENPLGPGKAAIDALVAEFDQAGRYPFNSRLTDSALMEALAKLYGAKPDNIVLGAGSGEVLKNAVRAFTSPERPLVTGSPSFESPVRMAEAIKTPVKAIPVDGNLRLDLELMGEAAKGAGLVFVCNPNNPTATVHSGKAIAELVSRIRKTSPGTYILLDEAYHDYVTDSSYATGVPLALAHPNVFVTRTFSKAYGMAGLRVGYAIGQAETIKELTRYRLTFNVNVLGVGAAIASLADPVHIEEERARNTEVRKFTMDFFRAAGFKPTDSQTNFLFVDLGRPAKDFREACEKQKVLVGRDFPPFEKTHARISIGTMEEMHRATQIFSQVLGSSAPTANGSPRR